MEKKTRSDAWESKLDDELRSRVYLAAGAARNFHEAKSILRRDFPALRLPSERAFYRFLGRMRNNAAMLMQRAAAAARDVKTMAKGAKVDSVELISSFQTLAAEAEFAGEHDRAKQLFDVVFGLARARAKNDELALAREKFEAAEKRLAAVRDAVETARTGGLTEETLKKIEQAAALL